MDWFIYTAMIFCHILDDFFLQGMCLSNLKQKDFWKEHAPDRMYRNDYRMALFIHSFSWSFMIMLPIAFAYNFQFGFLHIMVMCMNCIIHYFIDDLKANQKKINLIFDQTIHLIQITAAALIFLIK